MVKYCMFCILYCILITNILHVREKGEKLNNIKHYVSNKLSLYFKRFFCFCVPPNPSIQTQLFHHNIPIVYSSPAEHCLVEDQKKKQHFSLSILDGSVSAMFFLLATPPEVSQSSPQHGSFPWASCKSLSLSLPPPAGLSS